MEFRYETWPIGKLIQRYEKGGINLNPDYQRNWIWTKMAQKKLIGTIKNNQPIPNFFLRQLDKDDYEMVDGQQRARTIIGYVKGYVTDLDGLGYDQNGDFFDYPLNITLITKILTSESIEQFYALVNSTGLRVNRQEVRKARYYDSKFLELITDLASTNEFEGLNLLTETTKKRMNDIEFVSELVANLKFGIFDKKEKVDSMYEDNIFAEGEIEELRSKFISTMNYFNKFNEYYHIQDTRYKQKNDFYSLFDFINSIISEGDLTETLLYYYKILVEIGPYIKPSQEECEPFKNYALHCVSQSNSKNARSERKKILEAIFLNDGTHPNDMQRSILNFFKMKNTDVITKSGQLTINLDALIEKVKTLPDS